MKKNIEILLDTNPNGGCGCNCGCAGSNVVDKMNELADNLKEYNFETELDVQVLPISDFEANVLINKINTILDNTNAAFRINEENADETLSELLPLVVLDGKILTAFGAPELNEIIMKVNSTL